MPKAVIFDLDGVIIQSSQVQKYAFIKSYETYYGKYRKPPIEEFFEHCGNSLTNIFKIMGLTQEMIPLYQQLSRERVKDIHVFDGIHELMGQLKEQGTKCGICTGKDRERTIEILTHHKLLSYFDTIVCSDDVEHAKPAPDSLSVALRNLQIDAKDAVMVGDAVNDILCAKAASVFSIAVTWGDQTKEVLEGAKPDLLMHSIEELRNHILKNINLMDDFVIREDICNLQCDYCLTKTSIFKNGGDHKLFYEEGSDIQRDLDQILIKMCQYYDTAILKISGGEILLINNLLDFIRKQSVNYKVIQILTNGLLLNETMLEELSKIPGICIQLSLDHHTLEGNGYRTKKKKQLDQILRNLDLVVHYDIPVEINCVLTDKNTPVLKEFAEYLIKYIGKSVMLLPFPIRGNQKENYISAKNQYQGVERLYSEYERFKGILPPKAYLEELLYVIKTGSRRERCYIPKVANGLFDDGRRTPCPNYWFTEMNNILDNNCNMEIQERHRSLCYQFINANNPPKECSQCYTPWDIFNLYMEDKISLDELIQVPLYSFISIRNHLVKLKQILR